MSPRAAAVLAALLAARTAAAFDLDYVSHLDIHRPEIGLTEPSGLAVEPDGSGFWIVSDEAQTVFRLDANGDLRAFTGLDARMSDLEGIAVDPEARRLLLVSERTASILSVSTDPPHRIGAVDVAALPGPDDLRGILRDRRNGLEGITVDPESGAVFVLKEDKPRLLIEIAPELDRVVTIRRLGDVLPGGQDVSGIAADPGRRGLWIVSDTGTSVHFLADGADSAQMAMLVWVENGQSRPLDNPEGVALSPDGRSLFVVTDDGRSSKLVQYAIRDAP